jgi:hypothetical protein
MSNLALDIEPKLTRGDNGPVLWASRLPAIVLSSSLVGSLLGAAMIFKEPLGKLLDLAA